MRGDATLRARLLLRGDGLAGLAIVAGGITGLIAAASPWYAAHARVSMLGANEDQVVASLAGIPGSAPGWGVLVLALVMLVVGTTIAIDRPPAHARTMVAIAALAVAGAATAGLLLVPEASVVAGARTPSLLALRERLPVGIDLELVVVRGRGAWLALASAAVGALGAMGARGR